MPRNVQFWAVHPEALKARADVAPRAQSPAVEVGGIVDLPIRGPVLKDKRPGFASWADIREQMAAAKVDPNVRGILFRIDSPGGDVAGMQAAANDLRNLGKPSAVFVEALCCSAAFYFATATGNVWAIPSALVGGVGVYIPVDSDPADPAVVSRVTPGKHLPDSDPRAQEAAQGAADDLAECMLSDMARWAGLPDSAAAAVHFGSGFPIVAVRAHAGGMIQGTAMDPPFHLFNPAGLAPAIPGGAPMPGANARAEAEGLAPEALAEPVAEVEVEPAPDYAAMSPEERAALLEELKATMDAIKAVDKPADPAPDMSGQAAAFSAGLVAKGHILPRDRAVWERDFIANPGGTAVKALALKPALHTVPKGDARREPAPIMAKDQASAVQAAQALADKEFDGDYIKGRNALVKRNAGLAGFFGG